jgi:nucleotide-binding universal stress UspA family protein
VAYDGSKAARCALARAAGIAGQGGKVAVVHVIPERIVSNAADSIARSKRSQQKRLLVDAADILDRRGVEAQTIAAAGSPLREILQAADDVAADLIVVGRRQRQRPSLTGSLTAALVRSAKRDLLLVSYDGCDTRLEPLAR